MKLSFAFIFCIALTFSCKKSSDTDLKYAFRAELLEQMQKYSLLTLIEKTKGNLECQVDFRNLPDLDEKTKESLYTMIAGALNAWTEILDGEADWKWPHVKVSCKEAPLPQCVLKGKWYRCPNSDIIKVLVFGDEKLFDRSYAEPYTRSLFLTREAVDGPFKQGEEPFALLQHELGHLIGMDDTYAEEENGVPDQVKALMGYRRDNRVAQQDDIDAIKNLWRFTKKGGDPCGEGYGELQYENDKKGRKFCVKGIPDRTHPPEASPSPSTSPGGKKPKPTRSASPATTKASQAPKPSPAPKPSKTPKPKAAIQ